jgi:hypothetical protein
MASIELVEALNEVHPSYGQIYAFDLHKAGFPDRAALATLEERDEPRTGIPIGVLRAVIRKFQGQKSKQIFIFMCMCMAHTFNNIPVFSLVVACFVYLIDSPFCNPCTPPHPNYCCRNLLTPPSTPTFSIHVPTMLDPTDRSSINAW